MTVLSDKDIKKLVEEKSIVESEQSIDLDLQLGPSSIDLRLGYDFGVLNTRKVDIVDTKNMEKYNNCIEKETHTKDEGVVIHPGEFILGSTLEKVNVPDNLVARVEGRSSYGRLGIIVHASLPYEEEIFYWTKEDGYHLREIGQIVENEIEGCAVGFNPETKKVERFKVTDFITNPKKEIFKIKTERGREVKLTEDHNLFTVDEHGDIEKIKTQNAENALVAIPRKIPVSPDNPSIDLVKLFKKRRMEDDIMINSEKCVENAEITSKGMKSYYVQNQKVPLNSIQMEDIDEDAKLSFKQSNAKFSQKLEITPEFCYLAGFFIAEGYQRRKQIVLTNKESRYLKKVKNYFKQFEVGIYENTDKNGCTQVTINSVFFSRIFKALKLTDKRIIPELFNTSEECLEQLLQGLIDGDAAVRDERIEYYTNNKNLASDINYLCSLLGIASSTTYREREDGRDEYRVEIRKDPHKLLQRIPIPNKLLKELRNDLNLTIKEVASELGYKSKSSISNLENKEYETVKRENLQKIAELYKEKAETEQTMEKAGKLYQLANSDLFFDKITSVEETGRKEINYDLEVQPDGRKIENFLGGKGGIFLSNTAGYIDPGFSGDITLEIQNLGNAPVKLYPEDRVCQVVFETMTSEAEKPYGDKKDTKYMGQTGATGSRLDKEKRS